VGRTQKVPINFWQCEKPIRAGVLLKTCKGCDAAITPPKRLISEVDMKLVSLIAFLLAASPVAAQTPGNSTSQTCTQDPTYCSDIGASTSTTTGSGASGSASSGGSGGGGSGGGSSSGGAGAAAPAIPNAPCGDGFPMDAWGECN
jgi:hypothetical protein